MRSYPLLIGGAEEGGKGWTYVIHASDLIRDLENAFTFKRQLELGNIDPFCSHSPTIAGRCAWGGIEDCRRAIDAAWGASDEFSRFPLKERVALVAAVHEQLANRIDEFTEVLISEGHPKRLAEWEISGMLAGSSPETLEWLSGQLEHETHWQSRRLRIVRKPDGVVCVNPPQNAAASNSFMGLQALLAGNTLVVRAPQSAPLGVMYVYHELMRPVLREWKVPKGTVNVVSGAGRAMTKCWMDDPKVASILFFGDSKTGLRIGRECVEKGKKAVLELSGNDGLVVWKDADLDRAEAALLECFYGSSQICMVPKFAIVHPSIAGIFLERFVSRVRQLKPGYPDDPNTILTPTAKVAQFFEMLAEAEREGASTLCGGHQVDVDGSRSHKGLFVEPTVVSVSGFELASKLSCVCHETFFPLLPIVIPEPASDDELIKRTVDFLNSNEYGLRNSLWSQDEPIVQRFTADVRNGGILKVNDSHIGFLPYISTHGGSGRSGGPYGEMNYASLRLSRLQGIAIVS